MHRSLLIVACVAAGLVALPWGDPAAFLQADPELGQLLRAMALLKVVMVVAALALVAWRLGYPVSRGVEVGYVAGAAAMVGASVLLWNLAHIGVAALVFHLGAGLLIAGAFFDDGRRGDRRARARAAAPALSKPNAAPAPAALPVPEA